MRAGRHDGRRLYLDFDGYLVSGRAGRQPCTPARTAERRSAVARLRAPRAAGVRAGRRMVRAGRGTLNRA